MTPPPDPLTILHTKPTVTADEAAALLGVSTETVYRAARTGELGSVRVGRLVRIRSTALLALLDPDGATGPATPPITVEQASALRALLDAVTGRQAS